MSWSFVSRSASDFSYIFFTQPFETEEEARKRFNEAKAHASDHGGAGSLHNEGQQIDRFSIWCPND